MFYLCPYLTQHVYFGVDFWKSFEIGPSIFYPGIVKESAEKLVESLRLIVLKSPYCRFVSIKRTLQSFFLF